MLITPQHEGIRLYVYHSDDLLLLAPHKHPSPGRKDLLDNSIERDGEKRKHPYYISSPDPTWRHGRIWKICLKVFIHFYQK